MSLTAAVQGHGQAMGGARTVTGLSAPELSAADLAWVHALVQAYADICRTRMAGLPVLNPALQVEAVGFAPRGEGIDAGLVGVLITPWFMNLVWRAPAASAAQACAPQAATPVGETRVRSLGADRFAFIGACDAQLGACESCSLISPMFQFADQAAARATADEVLRHLFVEVASPMAEQPSVAAQPASCAHAHGDVHPAALGEAPSVSSSTTPQAPQAPHLPRRGFLLGALQRGTVPAAQADLDGAVGR